MADPDGGRRRVRLARPSDLRHLKGVEDAADEVLVAALRAPSWEPAPDGRDRALAPGFLLVSGDPPVGFAHVLELDGHVHLEQLAVHPDHARQGRGAALVRGAMEEARWAGHDRLSLCTFRDVAFNAPFYRRLGFVEVARPEPFQERLRAHERRLGLDDLGERVVMAAPLARP